MGYIAPIADQSRSINARPTLNYLFVTTVIILFLLSLELYLRNPQPI